MLGGRPGARNDLGVLEREVDTLIPDVLGDGV